MAERHGKTEEREGWAAPPEWGWKVDAAIGSFTHDANRSKQALALALGINPSGLSLSHLNSPKKDRYLYQRLAYALRSDRLFEIARHLRLDLGGTQALKRLAARVLEINTGYLLDPERMIESGREAADLGMMGVDYFDRDAWDLALPYLDLAWGRLRKLKEPTEGELYAALRVGTQITAWQSADGHAAENLATSLALLDRGKGYRGPDRKLNQAVSLLYKTTGVAMRHAGRHPEHVIEKLVIADRRVVEHALPRSNRIATLRDQAKPYIAWGLMEPSKATRYGELALARLAESEALGGGSAPREEDRVEWLLTRLMHLDCLAAMGLNPRALRLWDATMEQDLVSTTLEAYRGTALYAKWKFAEMAVRLSSGDMDGMGALAESFLHDPKNAQFGERLQRAQAMVTFASRGDRDGLQRVLIR